MQYYLVLLFSRIVSVLPKALQRILGNILGELYWLVVSTRRKKMAIENIARGMNLPQNEARAIAKHSVTRLGHMFIEIMCMPNLNKDNIDQYVTIEGGHHLAEALSHGRGAVIATAHAGNWEIFGAALAMAGFPLVAVAQKQSNAAMDKFITQYRNLVGIQIVYKKSVLEMVRLLGEGKIIGLIMDQDVYSDGVFVDFFGRKASTPKGAAVLARMKNTPIVPAFITEKSPGVHTAIIYPPVWLNKTADKEHDIFVTTQELTTIIEQHVRRHPHEWLWLHNRWKTAPPQEKQN